MLRATFCHIKGIGVRAEQRLWSSGVLDWARFRRLRPSFLSPTVYRPACDEIEESEANLCREHAQYFLDRLPGLHKIRLLNEFSPSVAFLDVETTGLGQEAQVTTAALCDERSLRCFVRERNLDELQRELRGSRIVVTFNGERFDLPVLRRSLGLRMRRAHLDLCPLMREMGYRGGLKECERLAGIWRRTGRAMNGARAAALWDVFVRTRDERVLRLLIAYNADDVLGLRSLAMKLYDRSMEMHPKRPKLRWVKHPDMEYDPGWESLFFGN